MNPLTTRTEIATLGEFALIDRLTRGITPQNETTVLGIGDDAAAVRHAPDRLTLVTTDLLLEGVHFDLTYTPLKHLGYKAAVISFSDIYAMNGRPTQLTVALGLSKRFAVEDVEGIYEGLRHACQVYGVDLVGGDTTASLTGLTLAMTCLGDVAADRIVRRDGAHDTDLICVSGDLGAAYMGLRLLEREKHVFRGETDFTPDFSGREYLLERQLRPEARRDIVDSLATADLLPTSMIDISDGLASELLHIATRSQVGCRIYEDRLPIDYQTAVMAEEFNMNLATAALNGGNDYELLFTLPLSVYDRAERLSGVRIIGHITRPELGCILVGRDGGEVPLQAQGWQGE